VLLSGLAGLLLVDAMIERVKGAISPLDRAAAIALPERRYPKVAVTAAALGVAALAACVAASLLIPQFTPRARVGLGLRQLLSNGIGEWQGSRLQIDREFMGRAWFREELYARYRKDDQAIDLFLGLGSRAKRDRTFWSPKTALPGSGWAVLDRGLLESTRGDTGGGSGDWQLLRAKARRVLVYHWYLGTAGLPDEAMRSLLALDSSPFESAIDGMVVRISTELSGPRSTGLAAARERLQAFQQTLQHELRAMRTAPTKEAISHFSLSGKTCSVVLVLNQLQNSGRTRTYATSGGGTCLAIVDHRYTGVPRGLATSS